MVFLQITFCVAPEEFISLKPFKVHWDVCIRISNALCLDFFGDSVFCTIKLQWATFGDLSLHIRKLVSLPNEMFTANSVHEDPVLGFFLFTLQAEDWQAAFIFKHITLFFNQILRYSSTKQLSWCSDTDKTVNSQSSMSHQWLKNLDLYKHSCWITAKKRKENINPKNIFSLLLLVYGTSSQKLHINYFFFKKS